MYIGRVVQKNGVIAVRSVEDNNSQPFHRQDVHLETKQSSTALITWHSDGIYPLRNGIYPLRNGIYALRNGIYPLRNGIYPLRNGIYPLRNGIYPLRNGIYLLLNGIYPLRNGIYPLRNGIYPLRNGIYPLRNAIYPLRNAIYPLRNGIYPLRNGIYPLRNGIYPSRNGIYLLRNGIYPLRNGIYPLRNAIYPLRKAIYPLRNGIYPLRNGIYLLRNGIYPLRNGIPFATAFARNGIYPLRNGIYPLLNGIFILCATVPSNVLTRNLEGTNISSLPGKGMTFVYKLNINNVINLWELPFKFFKNLWHAEVEYHFHCCLFKQILDGARDATPSFDNYSVVKTCPTSNPGVTTQPVPTTAQQTTGTERPTDIFDRHKESYDKVDMNYTLTFPPDKCVEVGNEIHTTKEKKRLICWPSPDAFNPCEDLLGTTGLRVCTWIVLVFALMGNGLQLIVLLTSKRNKVMYQVLMCNLSLANLLMGIYLTMLAVTDARSYGEYQNHARAWQYGPGCNIAGFLSILSTELAVYTLTVITIERYFTIVHPLKLHMHLSTKQIIILMSIGWSFALTMAALPVFGVSSYQRVAICLPFDVESTVSKAYVSFLLITNGLAFLVVLFCYARMYCSIGGTSCSSAMRVESRVAKKMALLVLSNFACWFPIALLSFIAIYGSPVIGVPTSKFLLVFIYPINSFTNPYLYALGTKHFQLDFLDLLKNFGACHNGIEKLRNRLLDQLTSLPNTSRAYMGSRSSVTSTYRTPPLLSTDNSHSRASMNASGSSSHSFSLRFLSIPKINLVSHRDKYDSSVERSASCISNDTSSEQFPTSQPLLKVEKNGARNVSNLEACRRLSAREVMIGGKVTNMGMFQSLGNSHSPNLRPHSMLRDGEDIKEYRASENKLPVVMVTSC
ncbi:hypothetical protein QZH41_006942 [Actinostola sp. cb2023]|nr:hypothetical protein QZH41_006942 [Actinostola sp. cb2023]